jgi:hypothetical protein
MRSDDCRAIERDPISSDVASLLLLLLLDPAAHCRRWI